MAVTLLACALLGYEARGMTFNADDFQFILDPRPLSLHVLLVPHAQSLSAVVMLAFRALLHSFGFGSYWPYIGLLLVLHAAACLLLYALARRSLGPWGALAPTLILGLLGPAWHDFFFATQLGYIGSVAGGLGALACLGRGRRSTDVGAMGLLVFALLCSSVGLGMVVLSGLALLAEGRRSWPRLWVAGIPAGLYVIWYLSYGLRDSSSNNLRRVPGHVLSALGAGVASITGLGHPHGTPFLIPATGGLIAAGAIGIVAAGYLLRGGRLPPTSWAALGAAFSIWIFAALAFYPSREPQQSRYQYPAAALLLLAAASAARGRPRRRAGVLLGVVTVVIVASNLVILDDGARYFRASSAYTAAESGAMEVARSRVAANYAPIVELTAGLTGYSGLLSVSAGPYLAAGARYGSPADPVGTLLRRPEGAREAADLVLQGAERITLVPTAALPARRAACRLGLTGPALGQWTLGPGRLSVAVAPGTPAAVHLRRFAAAYRFVALGNAPPAFPVARLVSGRPLAATLPSDGASLPWHLRISGGRNVRVCWQPAP